MTDDWATALTTKLLDNTPELKQVSLREIMASALRAERESSAAKADRVANALREVKTSHAASQSAQATVIGIVEEVAHAIRSGE